MKLEKAAIEMTFNSPQWTGITPREWQVAAFNAINKYFLTGGNAGVIRAIMGSGKSEIIAQLCATARLDWKNPVVVSTPSDMLVKQLRKTIAARVGGSKTVGCYYTERKDADADIIIVCNPSMRTLASALEKRKRRTGLWIGDECHKTRAETMVSGVESLSPLSSCGFTATPYRSNAKESITLFKELIYDYGPLEALRDGVIVKPHFISWTGSSSIPIDDACLEMIKPMTGPGLVNASSIEDAEAFAARLNQAGRKTETVHSRIGEDEIAARMERLKNEKIQCVSYVDMLCEGVDYPWLQWGCLRRDVGSRVRFHQELGRFCRSYIGKYFATILDPNDLFGLHKQSIAACLGCEPSAEDKAQEIVDAPIERKMNALATAIEDDEATALLVFEMELRRIIVACDIAGMCPDRAIVKRKEREKAITKLQIKFIYDLSDKALEFIPLDWIKLFSMLRLNVKKLHYGPASDLCCILSSIIGAKRFPEIDAAAASTSPESTLCHNAEALGTQGRAAASFDRWEQSFLEFERK